MGRLPARSPGGVPAAGGRERLRSPLTLRPRDQPPVQDGPLEQQQLSSREEEAMAAGLPGLQSGAGRVATERRALPAVSGGLGELAFSSWVAPARGPVKEER